MSFGHAFSAAHLRLAVVLFRRSRRECLKWVRNVIVNSFLPLVCAAVPGVAGGEPLFALGFCQTRVRAVPLSIRTVIEFTKC